MPVITKKWKISWEAKHTRNRRRPVREVHDGPDAVEQPTQGKKQQLPMRVDPGQLVVAEERAPAHDQVGEGREPHRHQVTVEDARSADDRGCPGCRECSPQPRTTHQAPGNGRIGPCDQQIDPHVIQALQPRERFAADPHAVESRAGAVAQSQGDAEDDQAEGLDALVARSSPSVTPCCRNHTPRRSVSTGTRLPVSPAAFRRHGSRH